MKGLLCLSRLSCLVVLFCCAAGLSAGTIRGRIFAPEEGVYLEGVLVQVAGETTATYSERGGSYRLTNLEPGSYEIVARYGGLESVRQTVTVGSRESVVELNFSMRSISDEVFELESLQVTSTVLGTAKALAQQRAADNLVNIVASDAFGQFVDRNPAEALKRLPGVSLQDSQGEGKFITIRGADPSLNSVAIDGVFAATPEEDGRTTGLNIISIDQLESIEVTKTWLPDQWANFIGGSVNLVTRSALDREGLFSSLEVAYGKYDASEEESYRVNAVFGDVFRVGDNHTIGFQLSGDYSEDNRGSDTLTVDSYSTDPIFELGTPAPRGFQFEGMDFRDFRIKRERSGVSAKLEYRLADKHEWQLSYSLNKFDDDETLQRTALNVGTNNYGGARFLTEELALQIGYDLSDPQIIARLNSPNANDRQITFEEAEILGDVAFSESEKLYTFQTFSGNSQKVWQSTLTEDEIETMQLAGEHRWGEHVLLEYQVYVSKADKNWSEDSLLLQAPDRRTISGINDDDEPFVVVDNDAFADPSVYVLNDDFGYIEDNLFSSTDERVGFTLDLEFDYMAGSFSMTTKVGLAADFRDKAFQRDFQRLSEVDVDSGANRLTLADERFNGGVLEGFLEDYGDYTFGPVFDTEKVRKFIADPGDISFEQTRNDVTRSVTDAILLNYEATEDIEAAYLMQTAGWKRWKFIVGLRYEKTENTFLNNQIDTRSEGLPPTVSFAAPGFWQPLINVLGEEAFITEVVTERSYEHWLPALHVIRSMGEDYVLRFAYTETIKRPEFTELVPREIPSVSGSQYGTSVRLPNFELQAAESRNFDLSLERYFEGLGSVGAAVFYKQVEGIVYLETKVIEPGQPGSEDLAAKFVSDGRNTQTWSTRKFANTGDGKLYGVEAFVERELDFLPDILRGFAVSANATLLESEVELLLEERAGESVPLFLQPDLLMNASLRYQWNGLLARVSLNYRDSYLQSVESGVSRIDNLTEGLGLPANALDTYDKEQLKVDVFLQYTWRNMLTVFLEGTNLTNEPRVRYYGTERLLSSIQHTQPVYFVGLQWKY